MKKGKHIKKGSYSKPKIKKSIFSIFFMLIIVALLFSHTKSIETDITQEITTQEVSESLKESLEEKEVAVDELQDTIETEEDSELEISVASSEDEDVKKIIQTVQEQNHLTEDNFAFFYYNLETKQSYFYDENTYFIAASTVKVPVAMYYYDMLNSNKITSETALTYTSDCYEAGGGTTAYTYSYGQQVPISFLLEQSVVNSDNTAVNILIKNLGSEQYRSDISKYTDETLPEAFYTSNLTSAAYAYDVMNYLYEHVDSYTELIENMKKSSMGIYLKKYIEDYDVAHKYGSYNGYVHDYGIVFGEQPYLIGVFTKNVTGADELIANINLKILNYTLTEKE